MISEIILKRIILTNLLFTFFFIKLSAQSPAFYPSEQFRVSDYGMAFNLEVYDINNDGKLDIIVGNWNDTYVYYGGVELLDSTVDITYTGRCLAVCDYNGDGFKDMITMHFTNYEPFPRDDYDGEILFYYGSNTTPSIDNLPEYSIPLPTFYPRRDGFSVGYSRPGTEYGDFNKDGKTDIVINSQRSMREGTWELEDYGGTLYIYMGSEIPADTATFKVHGGKSEPAQSNIYYYGYYFQVEDLNGDLYDDLVFSSKVNKYITIPPSPGPQDSLEILHIYMGNNSFSFFKDEETIRYESRLKNSSYSYGWFKKELSMMDINGDGFSDLLISHYYKDSTLHIHYGFTNVLDTIPSYCLTDPDTTREDIIIGQICHDVGDWNNDGYKDFLLKNAGYKTFSIHLGGPHLNNKNPYGMKGLLESVSLTYPTKAIGCEDQSGDGVNDFVVNASAFSEANIGYIIIFRGRSDIHVGVEEDIVNELKSFSLFQNYPNPFNPSTNIRYTINTMCFVTLKVYDVLGSEIAALVKEEKPAGTYDVEFSGSKLTSGIYFYRIQAGNNIEVKKMILIK